MSAPAPIPQIKDAVICITITGTSLAYASSGLKMFRPTFADPAEALRFVEDHNGRANREFTVAVVAIRDFRPDPAEASA